MIIQLHITDIEIKTFFGDMGYDCEFVEVPTFRRVTHGLTEASTRDELFVLHNGEKIQAKDLMNEYAKQSILKPANAPGVNVDLAINNLSKTKGGVKK